MNQKKKNSKLKNNNEDESVDILPTEEKEQEATGVAQLGNSNRAFMFQVRIIPFNLKDLKEVKK